MRRKQPTTTEVFARSWFPGNRFREWPLLGIEQRQPGVAVGVQSAAAADLPGPHQHRDAGRRVPSDDAARTTATSVAPAHLDVQSIVFSAASKIPGGTALQLMDATPRAIGAAPRRGPASEPAASA